MAEVTKVELDIQYPFTGTGTAQVTVRAVLNFAPEEYGKAFKLRMALYGSDVGERPGKKPGPPMFKDKPLYTFRFGLHDYATVQAAAGSPQREEIREIALTVLNEDPGEVVTSVPVPPGTPPGYMVTPYTDEIYAVVSLTTERQSEVFAMKYVPRFEQ